MENLIILFIVILFFDVSAKTRIKLHKNPWIFKLFQGSFIYYISGVNSILEIRGLHVLLRTAQNYQIFQPVLFPVQLLRITSMSPALLGM